MSSGSETQSLAQPPEADDGFQDVEKWSTGDFTLVSSDKFRFKVRSQDLFHASAVLRDAPAEGEKLIHFTDDKIETKAVLESFLTLATTGYLSDVENSPCVFGKKVDAATLNHYVCVIRFLQKYDCAPTLVAFGHQVTLLSCHKRISLTDAYCLGAIADDVQICAAAVALVGRGPSDNISMVKVSAEVWRLAKTKYLYALRKAENWQPGDPVMLMDAFRKWKTELNNEHIVFRETSQLQEKFDEPSIDDLTPSPPSNWELL